MLFLGGREMKRTLGLWFTVLYDLTNLKWTWDFVHKDGDFEVPKQVSEWIGGS
jgi:hypothetical protein